MYSTNDWRDYLEHSSEKKGKWEWPNGKNSKEYNQWYYLTHPEKWKVGENIEEDNDDEESEPEWTRWLIKQDAETKVNPMPHKKRERKYFIAN